MSEPSCMRHELIQIFQQAISFQQVGVKAVLATVVALDGSSYRGPGVRMLLGEHGQMVGAVSGGCVEKEVMRRARAVFQSGIPEMMAYDGRYRLGCEGLLYILLEPLSLPDTFIEDFSRHECSRTNWQIQTLYWAEDGITGKMGSRIGWGSGEYVSLSAGLEWDDPWEWDLFSQTLPPRFQLCIIGAEDDAVPMAAMAARLG